MPPYRLSSFSPKSSPKGGINLSALFSLGKLSLVPVNTLLAFHPLV